MRRFLIYLTVLCRIASAYAQQVKPARVYHPEANAQQEIDSAVNRAAKAGKRVFIQVGGNWCVSCVRFHYFMMRNDSLRLLLTSNFEVVHLNYSPENYNLPILKSWGNPQHNGGVPQFIVLDSVGNLLCAKAGGDFEFGVSFKPEKVSVFLRRWSHKKGPIPVTH